MIVMGAFVHSRFREAILCGVTRSLLDQAPVPLFMSHRIERTPRRLHDENAGYSATRHLGTGCQLGRSRRQCGRYWPPIWEPICTPWR